ncbi:MAG TPA: universal stress protein [Gemmatimonadales bacterium]|nr:universal stress protein [Gemmatimonadales bacterium]
MRIAEAVCAAAGADLGILGVETAHLPASVAVGEPVQRTTSTRHITWVAGLPGIEIARRAAHWNADLIVLGRGERTPASNSLGHTTDTLVRRHDGACLIVPPTVSRLDRMVIALDGTRRGFGILPTAATFSATLRSAVAAVCVMPGQIEFGAAQLPPEEPAMVRVREALSRYPALASAEVRVRQGNPVREIISYLEEAGASLLVLGVRRGGPPGEMGSGHVGQDLLREVPVAILTVPI